MISLDREWLEKVRSSGRSRYGKMDVEARARLLNDTFQVYLGVPVHLTVKNIPHYDKATAWLISKWDSHILKFPWRPRRRGNMLTVFLTPKTED